MKSVLSVLFMTCSLLAAGGLSESRGQEKKKAEPTAVKLQVELEDINVRGSHIFLTATFRITQPVGGETVSSKLVDVPVAPGVKININWAGTLCVLLLVEDQGGVVVVGIEAIEKGRETSAPKAGEAKSKRLNILKEPIGPRMVLAVNVNKDEKLVILEERATDLTDPAKPNGYVEYSQFSLKEGRAFWADGKPVPEEELWKHLPSSTSARPSTVLLSADEGALAPHFRAALKEGTIILIGEAVFRGVSSLPGEGP